MLRYHPFAGSSNPVGQVTLRCNFDVQCMDRVFVEPSGRAMSEEELQHDSAESGRGATSGDEDGLVESFCGDLESFVFVDGPKSCNKDAFGAEALELFEFIFLF